MPNGSTRSGPRRAEDPAITDVGTLLEWYGGADHVINGLEACAVVATGLLTGTPAANRTATRLLSLLVQNIEIWLLTHPCPTIWNAEFLTAFIDTVTGIGSYFEETEGTLPASDALFLAERTTRLDWMLEEIRGLTSDLEMLRVAQRSPNPGQSSSRDEA